MMLLLQLGSLANVRICSGLYSIKRAWMQQCLPLPVASSSKARLLHGARKPDSDMKRWRKERKFLSQEGKVVEMPRGRRALRELKAFTSVAMCVSVDPGGKVKRPLVIGDIEPSRLASAPDVCELIPWRLPQGEVAGRLVIVDGTAVLYRAYYRVQGAARLMRGHLRVGEAHEDVAATVLSALSTVVQILELGASHVVICFDAKGMNFRHELFPSYKGHRPPPPDAVVDAMPCLDAAITALGLTILKEYGVEADDVIGTLAVKGSRDGMEVLIASPDKDFFQLLSPRVRLLRPNARGSGLLLFGVEEFEQKYAGMLPLQFVDILALTGDQCDNVPGVRGIGAKTAPRLIREYGSVENLLDKVADIGSDRVRTIMEKGREAAILSKRLVKLQTNLPQVEAGCHWGSLAFRPPKDGGKSLWKLIDALQMGNVNTDRLRARLIELWKLQ